MPRPIKLKLVLEVLKRQGFFLVRQKGSHGRFEKTTDERTFKVTIKMTEKEIPYGTFRSILQQAGLEEDDFR